MHMNMYMCMRIPASKLYITVGAGRQHIMIS